MIHRDIDISTKTATPVNIHTITTSSNAHLEAFSLGLQRHLVTGAVRAHVQLLPGGVEPVLEVVAGILVLLVLLHGVLKAVQHRLGQLADLLVLAVQLPHKLVDLGGGRGLGQGLRLLPEVLDDVLAGQDVLVEHLLKRKMDDSIGCNGSLCESNDPIVK